MAKLTLSVPIIGEKRTTAEPKVDTALSAIETWANGGVGLENLENAGVTEAKLSAAVQTLLNEKTAGGTTKKSIIATEQSRTSATFGTLTTPDEVEVTLATNGLLAVWFQATWLNTVVSTGKAALFLGANQVKQNQAESTTAPAVAESNSPLGTKFTPISTSVTATGGLTSGTGEAEYTGDVTTGQIINGRGVWPGAPLYIFAAAGTYKISVRFKSSSGTVTAKNRKLWAITLA